MSAALNHLYSSITQLEPVTDKIDAKIKRRVISGVSAPGDRERNRHFSAQDVMQNMTMLKTMHLTKTATYSQSAYPADEISFNDDARNMKKSIEVNLIEDDEEEM